jgi:hypothetical protein
MSHGHGVDNCSLRSCKNGKQLNLTDSRSPTQIFQRNLQPTSHRFSVYVCAFGPGLNVMVMLEMEMVMVMVAMLVSVLARGGSA